MKKSVKISVITVNFNGFADTCQLIESLHQYCDLSLEIVVIDNGSKRDEAAMLKLRFPNVIAIRSEVNLGFAGGNNIGINNSDGEYLLFLNNDTIVEDNTIHFLVEKLDSDSRIGGVSPKIKFAFEPRNIQFAGYTPLTSVTLRNSLIGFNEADCGQYDITIKTPYLHGAAMMIKRNVIASAGLIPECYFLYYEELDWSYRITELGYDLWYEPNCTIYHKESSSIGQQSPLKIFYITRNRLLFAWRNSLPPIKYLSVLYQLTIAGPKNTLMFLLSGERAQSMAVIRGCIGFFKLKK